MENGFKWCLMGMAVGYMGARIGSCADKKKMLPGNMKKEAARITARVSRRAGRMISDMGQCIASRMC